MASSADGLSQRLGAPASPGLETLLEQHGPEVRQRLAGRVPDRFRAVLTVDDVMQQTYTDAFLEMESFSADGSGDFRAWLLSLARCNLADALRMLNAQKRGKGRRQVWRLAGRDSHSTLFGYLVSAGGGTPSQTVAVNEACAALKTALTRLPEMYRQVVEMYDLEDRSIEDVAAAIGRSPGAAYMIRARAHDRLRSLLGDASKYLTSS